MVVYLCDALLHVCCTVVVLVVVYLCDALLHVCCTVVVLVVVFVLQGVGVSVVDM